MKFRLPSVYPITDQQLSGLSHADQVKLLARGGARFIQLRDKDSSPREFLGEAASALRLARQLGVKVIINDRVDIALAAAADGVHLGQDDMPPKAARRLLGKRAIIGFSTHSAEQAIEASKEPVDYIALGPIFHTSTKTDIQPVVGLAGLSRVRRMIGQKPLVAIGGISEANAVEVFHAGADSIALIGALLRNRDEITDKMKTFLNLT